MLSWLSSILSILSWSFLFYSVLVISLIVVALYVLLLCLSRTSLTKYDLSSFRFISSDGTTLETSPPARLRASCELDFTLVIPCYQEEKRLRSTFEKCTGILSEIFQDRFEVIFVDDGCKDGTNGVIREILQEQKKKKKEKGSVFEIRLLDLVKNYGKGFALKQGLLRSRGRLVAFTDADGAPDFGSIREMMKRMKEIATAEQHGMVMASRYSKETNKKTTRRLFRHVASWGLRQLFRIVSGISGVRDSQCGFKLYTSKTAHFLASNMRVDRWATDIEMLMLCKLRKIPFVEVPIDWVEKLGGTFGALRGAFQIGKDLVLIRLFYSLGFWKVVKSTMKERKED